MTSLEYLIQRRIKFISIAKDVDRLLDSFIRYKSDIKDVNITLKRIRSPNFPSEISEINVGKKEGLEFHFIT